MVNIAHRIQFLDYAMAASKGARVYRRQLGICNADEALMPIALVVAKGSTHNHHIEKCAYYRRHAAYPTNLLLELT